MGEKPNFVLNRATVDAYKKAFRQLARVADKNDPDGIHKLAMLSGRRVVKNLVDITPPSQGQSNSAAKKRGEQAILSDLLLLAIPIRRVPRGKAREQLATAQDLIEVHRRSLVRGSGQTGHRVNPRNRKYKLRIRQSDFNSVLKPMQTLVGWLSAALNVAARRLGLRLSNWVARHGTKYGLIDVRTTAAGIRIRVVQNVPFADDVSGYSRKWEFAFQKETTALLKQATAIAKKKLARSGLKTR